VFYVAPFIFLQCLGALLAWALITRRAISGSTLAEAGAVWLMPLIVAGAFGFSADMLVRIAACGVVFNLANWLWQGAPQRSE